ncbi:CinA family protein [Stappia sp.]|uniref:CinA family protein n=1 Tax=Stappia sp. TaxID=1870903 RepID=UPI003A9A27C4
MTDLAPLFDDAAALVTRCAQRGLMIATAESCTGGLIAGVLTEVPGSSAVLDRGFVTYSNEAKMEMIGVPGALIETHGAVSREVALAMAEGALAASRADLAVAVTGIAGPGGGSPDKPVGLVHFGIARKGQPTQHVEERFGPEESRGAIRLATVRRALAALSNFIDP